MLKKDPIFNIMQNVVLQVSKFLKRDFNEVAYVKTQRDVFYKKAQQKAIHMLSDFLLQSNINYGIIVNSEVIKKSNINLYWMLEGIDTAENFMNHISLWGVCVALCDENRKILNAIYYMPMLDDMFFAQSDAFFWNGRRMRMDNVCCNDIMGLNGNLNFGSNLIHFIYCATSWGGFVIAKNDLNAKIGQFFVESAGGRVETKGNFVLASASPSFVEFERKFDREIVNKL